MVNLGGCKKSDGFQGDPVGALLEANGCKQNSPQKDNNHMSGVLTAGVDDCINYSYDGESTLTFRHINAGFNCCPGEITAVIDFNGNLITITEIEEKHDCHCLCLFDLDYEVINLRPGRYTIRIIEPYVEENHQALVFTVDLSSALSGNFCLTRNHYPWVQ
jgi:hypothetical protein